jgi:hypothetical protein
LVPLKLLRFSLPGTEGFDDVGSRWRQLGAAGRNRCRIGHLTYLAVIHVAAMGRLIEPPVIAPELSQRDPIGYHDRMPQKFIVIAAWVSIAAVAYATLTHVGFVYSIYFKLLPFLHTKMTTYAHFEHVIAFAFLGGLFYFAYPKRVIFVFGVIIISAVSLEYLQTLTPDRHGTLIDACEKIMGGAVGILAARALLRLRPRVQS